jgi:hypothetical protein
MSSKQTVITIAIFLIFLLPGCGREQAEESPAPATLPQTTLPLPATPGCQTCHPFVLAGTHATLTCTTCHNGDKQTADFNKAHVGLTARPAHPTNMQDKCGSCHQQTTTAPASRHFTLANETNMVRRHFGADHDLKTLLDIPVAETPSSSLQLADDVLRRRCLRCHVYYEGDEYSKVRHGTGCAACHLEYQDGKLVSHRFLSRPTDRQCLSCHSGNRVGSDYYGLFDHDFKHEYRTPYQTDGSYPARPYGVEQHRLSPDIHQQAGMTCSDCHLAMHGGNTMQTISCEACHLRQNGQPAPAPHLRTEAGQLLLTTSQEGLELVVPPAPPPIHSQYQNKAACTVCHAQWSYNDQNTNLLRIDHDDYEEWDELFVQDSSEVEVLLLNGIYGAGGVSPAMTDKITGQTRPGLWLKGFRTRRWEVPVIDFDRQGKLQVMRPVLDLQLSWVDENGKTVFDAISGKGKSLRAFTPHTIGKAGPFYRQRIAAILPQKTLGKTVK